MSTASFQYIRVNLQQKPRHERLSWNRLSVAVLVLLVGILGISGCNSDTTETTSDDIEEVNVSTVPLRIVSMGGEAFDQRLSLAWQSVSQQPIEITAVRPEALLEASEKADIVIFANQQAGDLHASTRLAAIPEVMLGADGINSSTFLPSVSADLLSWGPGVYSVPLGAIYPAVWFDADIRLPSEPTWGEYEEALEGLEKGQVAEPLAEGWAGIAFLWRAATMTREMWLFDRQTMEPQLTSEPYLKALTDLIEARKKYPDALMSPEEIWAGLSSGSLKMAIAWPTVNLDVETEAGSADGSVALSVASYPLAEEVYLGDWVAGDGQPQPPMLGPGGLSVGVASSCRQTQVARAFIRWIASRDGHAALRGADNLVLPNRTEQTSDADDLGAGGVSSIAAEPSYAAYDRYLLTALSQAVVRPSLRIPGSGRYLSVLDAEVLSAVSGERTAEEALQRVADQWELLTKELDARGQINAWRQSQGMRER